MDSQLHARVYWRREANRMSCKDVVANKGICIVKADETMHLVPNPEIMRVNTKLSKDYHTNGDVHNIIQRHDSALWD